MRKTKRSWSCISGCAVILTFTLTLLALVGCDRKKEAPAPPPVVTVAEVTQQTIPMYLNYVATTQAVGSVDIRARVEGFLQKQAFADGADVKKGDLLFVIDPSPFQATLDSALAQLAKDEATLAYVRQQAERYRPLAEKEFITRNTFEQYRTEVKEAEAAVEADRAAVTQAKLNLGYCKIYAPFDGRIGRGLVDVGNLVGADEDTRLATLVQLDPIYVYFSPTEREIPQILRQKQTEELSVTVLLPDESVHPHRGSVDFVNNTVDSSTGTITMRAVVPNPERTLLPGQYTQVQLLLGMEPDAILVPEQAVGEDQGGFSVLVVGKDNKVQNRDVVAGVTYKGMRVIEKGVKPGERIIVEGLQKVRPGIVVQPKLASSKDESKLPSAPRQPPQGPKN